jgi:hypothetical protein
MTTNRDRMTFLRARANDLAEEITKQDREQAFLSYLANIRDGKQTAQAIDEQTFDLLLPAEKEQLLFAHYHTVRTELLELMEKADEPSTLQRVAAWFESPWVKSAMAVATLTEVAKFLYQILSQSGLFLVDDDGRDLRER